jgi:hypothetical protein
MPWSLRQPLQTLNKHTWTSMQGEALHIYLDRASAATDLLNLKAGMGSLKGLLRLTHVAGHVCRAGACMSMVPILELKDLQDQGTFAALKRRR